MIHFKYDAVSVFLNRSCPRNCPQCGLTQEKKKHLSIDEWIQTFQILNEELGVRFFLILGTEPLLFGDDLVKLIKWFTKNNLFYAFYSTSPPALFKKYREKLIDAGLTNWACGIDTLPGKGWTDAITEKKTQEGIEGLIWMGERGLQTWTLTTVTNQNLQHVPEIVEWCQLNIPNVLSCVNPVEWRHNDSFDFFARKEDMADMVIPAERHEEVIQMAEELFVLTRRPGFQIQNPDSYLLNYPRFYNTLNYVCNGVVGFGVDCDGSLRLCGYSKGAHTPKYFVKDLQTKKDEILMGGYEDAHNCLGCHWSYVSALQETYESLIPGTAYYTERHKQAIPSIREHLKRMK